jgi:hypothetical protein
MAGSADHLVRQEQEGWGDRDPQRLRGLEVEDGGFLPNPPHAQHDMRGIRQKIHNVILVPLLSKR